MKKVIYASYQDYALTYAKHLHEELGWYPVLWHVIDDIRKPVEKTFPGVLVHEYSDAIKGKLPSFIKEEELLSVDSALLQEMAVHESLVLNMMNRNYISSPFTYQHRFRLYIRLLRFYVTILDRLKPDYIVFEETPHQACDYLLYTLAHRAGIPVILFETSFLPRYFLPMARYDQGNTRMQAAYQAACSGPVPYSFKLSEYAEAEIRSIRGDYASGKPYYMVPEEARFREKNGLRVRAWIRQQVGRVNMKKIRRRIRYVLSLHKPALHNDYIKKNTNIEDSVLSYREYYNEVCDIVSQKKSNLKFYQSIEDKTPNLSVPFVYCTLHAQPEKTSSPAGGYYANQYLMLQMLSKAVPEGWKIYVKDHITQYLYPERGEAYRDTTFFMDILKLKNVSFVPIDYNSFDLIDHSKAVATLTGRVLWESVIRGKPALAFGEGHKSWIGGCEGVYAISDHASLKLALQDAASGKVVDLEKVKLYAHFIEKFGYQGYAGGKKRAHYTGVSVEDNGRLHADAIRSHFGLHAIKAQAPFLKEVC